MLELVRGYGRGTQNGAASIKLVSQKPAVAYEDLRDNESEYQNEIAADLIQKDYAALEAAARDARTRKTKFSGGVWKLYTFYKAVSAPIVGSTATDEDWAFHISNLKA
jgi:hypothetical protein